MSPLFSRSGWFAVIRNQDGSPSPLVDEDDDIVIFSTERECEQAAESNMFGSAYGFQVYYWDSDV